MKFFFTLIVGIVVGALSVYFYHHGTTEESSEQAGVESESEFCVLEPEPLLPTIVEGDLDNLSWQKEIYSLYQAIGSGDVYGDERVEAQRKVDDYIELCSERNTEIFPHIRQQKVNELYHFFNGLENFKKEIEQFRETNNGYYLALTRLTYDEAGFYGYANREYYQFLVDDLDDGIVGWDKTRQKLASDLFGIDDPISDKGFYRYIGENFDQAVSTKTYQKFWSQGRLVSPK